MDLRMTVLQPQLAGSAVEILVSAEPGTALGQVQAELLAGVGADPGCRLWHDGHPVDPATPLGLPPLLHGAVLLASADPARVARSPRAVLDVQVVSGPDAGRVFALPPGVCRVGRAPGHPIQLADPEVSRDHLELVVDGTQVLLRDLGSANGCRVGGQPVPPEGCAVAAEVPIEVGATRLVIRRPPEPAACRPDGAGQLVVNRAPRHRRPSPAPSLSWPSPPRASEPVRLSWISMVVPLVISVPMALIWHQPFLLALGLAGPLAMGGQYLLDRRRHTRQRTQAAAEHAAAVRRVREAVVGAVADELDRWERDFPDLAAVSVIATTPSTRLWERELGVDGCRARAGRGRVPSTLRITGEPPTEPPPTTGPQANPEAPALLEPQATTEPPAGLTEHADAPVQLDLAGSLGISGPRAAALGLARALLGQLATLYSPADLEICVLTGSAQRDPDWEWVSWLPHTPSARTGKARHRLVVLDGVALASTRTDVVQALDAAGAAAGAAAGTATGPAGHGGTTSVLCLESTGNRLPRQCSTVIDLADPSPQRSPAEPSPSTRAVLRDATGSRWFRAEPAGAGWAWGIARALAPLRDPAGRAEQGLPTAVDLASVLRAVGVDATDPAEIRRRWARGPAAVATIGVEAAGPMTIDLRRDGPHVLLAGTTGAGKSELLRTLVTSLAVSAPPDRLSLLLVDYKGGAAFSGYEELPQVTGVITDLDDAAAQQALAGLRAEIRHRERVLAAAGCADLHDYHRLLERADQGPGAGSGSGSATTPHRPPLPRLVIVIDEFRVLAEDLPQFVPTLVRLAAVGRSLGVHLVLATQRPAGAVSAELRANVNLRIALRVSDRNESSDVIDSPLAADLDPGAPGRAVLRCAGGPTRVFQTALVGSARRQRPRVVVRGTPAPPGHDPLDEPGPGRAPDGVTDLPDHPAHSDDALDPVVTALRTAAAAAGQIRPAPPWLPALPQRFTLADQVPGCARPAPHGDGIRLGVADHPAERFRHWWSWSPSAGRNLALAGGPRSGRSTAIRTLAGELDRGWAYVIDGSGALADLRSAPRVAAVVPVTDVERCARLLRLLSALAARRSTGAGEGGGIGSDIRNEPTLLLIDGWEQAVDAWTPHEHAAAVDAAVRLVRDGPAAGVQVVVSGGRALLTGPIAAHLTERLVLPMADPADELVAGVPTGMAGRSRGPGAAVWLGTAPGDGLAVHLALPRPGGDPARVGRRSGDDRPEPPVALPALPHTVRLPELVGPARHPARGDGVVIGVGGDRVEPVVLPIEPGGGALVVGSPGSGRSTALATITADAADPGPGRDPERDPDRGPDRGPMMLLGDPWDPAAVDTVRRHPGACMLVDSSGPLPAELDQALRDHLLRGRQSGGRVVVACDPGQVLAAYSGVLAELRARRTGLLLGSLAPGEGECFGLRLPPRPAGPPGRGLLVTRGHAVTVQVALPG